MWVNQPFTTPIGLGDMGTIDGGRFDTAEATSLAALDIPIGATLVGQPQRLAWQSSQDDAFEFAVKAQGESVPGFSAIADADAGFRVNFGKKGSYIFETDEAVIERIDETEAFHAKWCRTRSSRSRCPRCRRRRWRSRCTRRDPRAAAQSANGSPPNGRCSGAPQCCGHPIRARHPRPSPAV